jgi:hypothetical protein
MFLAAKNLVSAGLVPCAPWEFKLVAEISAQIRKDKESRQDWYKTENTDHQFYTSIEPLNPNIRISKKENPPLWLHGLVADYDLPVPQERVLEAIKAMPIKPTYVERSLGGNFRLVWVFEKPIRLDSYEFCTFLLTKIQKPLGLEMLPGLDAQAFINPTRLYCNGGEWVATGAPPVPVTETQPLLVDASKEFRWPIKEETSVPLAVAYAKLKEKYPELDWPSDFSLDTPGPSFWVPGSTSPSSAIVKAGGMISFAAHATKQFTPWDDDALLGAEFCKQFRNNNLTKATEDVWFDGKHYHRVKPSAPDTYTACDLREFSLFLKGACKLSTKPIDGGSSPLENALIHINETNFVSGVGPFVLQKKGIIDFQGRRMLNTYFRKPIEPATGPVEEVWGPHGNFPFISLHLSTLFNPVSQLDHWIAWYFHFYMSALNWVPNAGQNVMMLGGTNVGKTLTNRQMVGVSVGGFTDAAEYLIDNGTFNSHLFYYPFWCLDDTTPGNTPADAQRVIAILKKFAANNEANFNEKYKNMSLIAWAGRVGITANIDFVSSRLLYGVDKNSLDKTHIFRCAQSRDFKFPSREEVKKILAREMPHFLKWLTQYKVPDHIIPCSRFGYMAHHEKSLLDQGYQTGPSAGFKECLIKALTEHFLQNPKDDYFEGTVTDLVGLIKAASSGVIQYLRLEQANKYLEQIQDEGALKCEARTGQLNTRVWRFENFLPPEKRVKTELPMPPNNDQPNKFQA